MNTARPTTVYLKDYAPPPFLIPEVELDIDFIDERRRIVVATLVVRRNPQATGAATALRLDVDELHVESVAIDGRALAASRFVLDERHLTLEDVPDELHA